MAAETLHPRPTNVPAAALQSRPLLQRPVVRLAAVAVLSFVVIVALLRPSAHDADWWKHAGLKDNKARPERVVFGDDGIILEANIHHDQQQQQHRADVVNNAQNRPVVGGIKERVKNEVVKALKHEDGVVMVGPHDNNMPPKRDGGKKMRPLVEGVDYFADYNVSAVKIPADPPLKPGTKVYFNYIDPSDHPEFAMQYVSSAPRVLYIQDFLSHAECDAIVEAASHKLFRSQVAPLLNSKENPVQEVRTSSQAWLPLHSPEVKPIADRLLKLTGLSQAEEMQVLRYELTQKYDAHNDYFDPKMYGPQQTNRAVTVFLYLTDVDQGGETQFPRADGKGPTFDFTSCTHGLRVRPRKGQVALFYDMKPWGELDPSSLHGGCPVKKGIKWGGTLWLRVPTGGT